MAEYSDAIDCFVDRSRVFQNQNSHSAVVIHGTGGSAGQTAMQLGQFFATTDAETSVHYGIDRTGIIAQYVLEQDGAAGSCCVEGSYDPFWDQFPDNKNLHILCVETVNDVNNSLALTDPQKATLFKLVAYWVKKYNIPLSSIKGHFSLDPVNRARCPGPNFVWDELFAYLKGKSSMAIDLSNQTVARHFTGSSDIWQCKDNGFIIGHAILAFYQKFGGDALCGLTYLGLPKGNERAIAGHPGVVEQDFERATVRYDQGHTLDNPPGSGPVYLIHIEQSQLITSLQAQIAALQKQPALANLQQINTLATQASATLAKIGTLSQVQ